MSVENRNANKTPDAILFFLSDIYLNVFHFVVLFFYLTPLCLPYYPAISWGGGGKM